MSEPTEKTRPEPPPGWGGLAPLIAVAVAMVAIWFLSTHKTVTAPSISFVGAPGATEDEATFRRAYLSALLRAAVSDDETERKAAETELRSRRETAASRPGGLDGLDAWVRETIERTTPRP